MLECHRGTCINQISRESEQEVLEECKEMMNKTREARHLQTMNCQKDKFERLCLKNKGDHSNRENQNQSMSYLISYISQNKQPKAQ